MRSAIIFFTLLCAVNAGLEGYFDMKEALQKQKDYQSNHNLRRL